MWSLLLLVRLGFCSSKIGAILQAARATFSRHEPSAYAWYRRASSATNDFPADPDGIWNKLRCQWITSLYTSFTLLKNTGPSKSPQVKFGSGGVSGGHPKSIKSACILLSVWGDSSNCRELDSGLRSYCSWPRGSEVVVGIDWSNSDPL